MQSLTSKYNSFPNKNNGKTTHGFAPRPQIFKLQLEVLKFNDGLVEIDRLIVSRKTIPR